MEKLNMVLGICISTISITSYADCISTIDYKYLDSKLEFADKDVKSQVKCQGATRAYDKAVCSNEKLKRLDDVAIKSFVADYANGNKLDLDASGAQTIARKQYQYRYKKAGKTPESVCKFLMKELGDTQGG